MADATWPSSLPQAPDSFQTYRRVLRNTRIESPVDSGPPRLRSVSTQSLYDVSFSIYVTRTQLDAFENFYNSTLAQGTQRFNWKDFELDPATPASNVEYQFAGAKPYDPKVKGKNNYILSLKMIMFPA